MSMQRIRFDGSAMGRTDCAFDGLLLIQGDNEITLEQLAKLRSRRDWSDLVSRGIVAVVSPKAKKEGKPAPDLDGDEPPATKSDQEPPPP